MDKSIIYKYIDEKGIPFKKMVSIETSLNEQDRGYKYKEFIQLNLPFNLSQDKQVELVLKYIYDLTTFIIKDINDLLQLKALHNKPFILELNENSNSVLYVAFKNIPGSIIIRGDQQHKNNGHEILTLGNIELIDEDLGLSYTKIFDLGKLKQIKKDFWFSGSEGFKKNGFRIKTLSPLETVNGSVTVKGKSLQTLGTLKHVGKNLSLRFSNVRSLGELSFVGGNLLISKYNLPFYDFSKVKVIGKILKYNDLS